MKKAAIMRVFLLVVVAFDSACFTTTAADHEQADRAAAYSRQLPPEDRDMFARCLPDVNQAQCGTAVEPRAQLDCGQALFAEVYALRDSNSRRAWLIRKGCPRHKAFSQEELALDREAKSRKIAIDRLSLESGCDKARIRIVQESEWMVGGQRSYRLDACGTFYVCATGPSGADCKVVAGPASAPKIAPVE